MYQIYADGECIYNDIYSLDDMKAVSPKLTLEDNAAGSLSITLPQSHRAYGTIVPLVTDISVNKEGKEIWSGRVLSENKDFWNNRVLYCEGELAFFNDSAQPQMEYKGLTVRGFLEKLIIVHNSKVGENRRFSIGAVTVHSSEYTADYCTNYEKTIECINEKLVKQLGGHLRIRKENGVRYLDYLAEYPTTTSQTIQFGVNLLDFTRKWDWTEFATAVLPLGSRLKDSPFDSLDSYLTVESVNNGSPYIQSPAAVEKYGWIEKVVNWNECASAPELLNKAKTYLSDLQFDNMEIELSALDLHYLHVDYEDVSLLDEIQVISRPHGMDRLFPVTRLEIPLDSPEKTQFKLGDTVKTNLTSVNNQISAAIIKKIEELPKRHSMLKEAKENATAIMNLATTGYITITKDQYGSDTLYISNTRDYTKADKIWKWNMNGLGYSKDGGKTFGLAMTMDGSIVADYITSGVLNADIIRAGILKDPYNNFSLDFETGKLVMKKGSINIGNNFIVDEQGNLTARRGTFAGKLVAAEGTFAGSLYAAKIYGDLVADDNADGWIRGCGISVGGDDWKNGMGNFYVDTDGNVTMAGSIKMAGNITWSTGSSPCQILYARTALSAPSGRHSNFPSNSSYGWHRNLDSNNDYYASYTYDGGVSWTTAIQIRGMNGQNGSDGTNGEDAEVTRKSIYRAMLKATDYDGLYSYDGDLLINASAIRTGTIDAGEVYLQDDNGCFCSARGHDGISSTRGAKMSGSDDDYYFIATNRGVRMTGGGHSIYAAASGCFSSEEFGRGSDIRIKNSIMYDMDKYRQFFLNLKPAAFRLNGGRSNRFHLGFIAQEVEKALLDAGMETADFAGFVRSAGKDDVHDDYEDQCYLRYDNFISLNTYMIQSAIKEIDRLRHEIETLKQKESPYEENPE